MNKNFKFLIFAIGFSFFTSVFAKASTVNLWERAYSASNCVYFSTNLADFHFEYQNTSLPWGSRVFLVYGFYDSFSKQSMQGYDKVELRASQPYTWTVQLNNLTIAERSSFTRTKIQFYFRIVLPNQQILVDKGSPNDPNDYYYSSDILPTSCQKGSFQKVTY